MGNLAPAQPKKTDVNLKLAEAGRIILEDPTTSLYEALTTAGYAQSTARAPARNGLSVSQCISEAVKLEPDKDPSDLLRLARLRLGQRLELLHGDELKQAKVGDLARTVDVVEKHYAGHSQTSTGQARSLVDRMTLVANVVAELERRGEITVNRAQDKPTLDSDSAD